jgi:hypothetical protein
LAQNLDVTSDKHTVLPARVSNCNQIREIDKTIVLDPKPAFLPVHRYAFKGRSIDTFNVLGDIK